MYPFGCRSGWCRPVTWKATGHPTVRQHRGKWVVRVEGVDTATGMRRPHQLGTFKSQRAARNAAAEYLTDGAPVRGKGNVAKAVDQWLESKSEVSAKSFAQYEWAAKHVKAGLGGVALDDLERTDVADWLADLAAGGQLARRGIQICRMVLPHHSTTP
jgi:hypothetical protein